MMNDKGARMVSGFRVIVKSRRWFVGMLAAAASLLLHRNGAGAFQQEGQTYNGRRISIAQENGAFVVQIDGVPVDRAIPVEQIVELGPSVTPPAALATPGPAVMATFNSDFFPFRTFESPEQIARAMVDTEGQLWLLS